MARRYDEVICRAKIKCSFFVPGKKPYFSFIGVALLYILSLFGFYPSDKKYFLKLKYPKVQFPLL
jgi:hypothetical protein